MNTEPSEWSKREACHVLDEGECAPMHGLLAVHIARALDAAHLAGVKAGLEAGARACDTLYVDAGSAKAADSTTVLDRFQNANIRETSQTLADKIRALNPEDVK